MSRQAHDSDTQDLPAYYVVEGEIYVVIMEDGEDVIAFNHWGNPYPPFKAMVMGNKITKQEFERGKREATSIKRK